MQITRSKPRLLTLILLTSLAVMSLNMFLPSLSRIASEFEADYSVASLSIGGYLAISALLQLVMGPLSDMVGRRPVILTGLAIFTLASIGCALAGTIWVFLGFRLLQGAVVSGMVLSRAVIRDVAVPSEAARLLAVVGSAMALAPLLAPVLGGVLDQFLGWRSDFWVFALCGAALFILCWIDLGETNLTRQNSFRAQFRTYPELLRSGSFWAYCACLIFSIGGFYAYLAGAPQVGEQAFNLSPSALGLLMGATAAGFMVGNVISTRIGARVGMMALIIAGRWVSLGGIVAAMALLAIGVFHPAVLFAGAVMLGLGNGLTLPGANAGVMSVQPRLAGSASGLSGALTVGIGAVLTPLVSAMVTGPMGVYVLLGAMALASLAGVVAAYVIQALDRRLQPA
ncbi:Sulfonamide resistance protein [Thalassovita gelatinovora]|uniref:Bcr/CflA family efflux transporter n=1 Tax=Thalassovita gelatinovora TaxID=53501 RepID=A0A0P1FKH9_THAGE|nr:multidrug effflux MFS transporter [Thalassovita gelatinovora]QIZ79043.1 multidrug effflux MFS transporter [Thalassovita gelatinovora]CUH68632.1 Sulfonamide resistance protein [Thalassovita gelatinovora]SEQ55792.1 drug resistance transporter, Bcr/CflA subfamily [Thalassovita gelatinovora]